MIDVNGSALLHREQAQQTGQRGTEDYRDWNVHDVLASALALFAGLRVVRYEDTDAKGDFGLEDTHVVRLAAVKP